MALLGRLQQNTEPQLKEALPKQHNTDPCELHLNLKKQSSPKISSSEKKREKKIYNLKYIEKPM